MISEIRIQHFKSIHDLTLKPGRVTVLIGENGSGKSNILEAVAFAAGASAKKLDSTFLSARGIRVTDDTWMHAAFPSGGDGRRPAKTKRGPYIQLSVKGGDDEPVFECRVFSTVREEDGSFAGWDVRPTIQRDDLEIALRDEEFSKGVELQLGELKKHFLKKEISSSEQTALTRFLNTTLKEMVTRELLPPWKQSKFGKHASTLGLAEYLIYAPENTVLRNPPPEGAIEPLGTKGEGLLKLLQSFTNERFSDRLKDMKERLHLFGWFDDFLAPDDAATAQARLQIRDRWLAPEHAVFDQRSANEGFLFVLFYFTLLMSWRTPTFFAIDNVDSALNPKLCSSLLQQIVELAKKYNKQVICTTHNPAILDGMDLRDDAQRLFAVRRNSDGCTALNRIRQPQPQPGERPVRLSEAFMRGIIGGLPDNF